LANLDGAGKQLVIEQEIEDAKRQAAEFGKMATSGDGQHRAQAQIEQLKKQVEMTQKLMELNAILKRDEKDLANAEKALAAAKEENAPKDENLSELGLAQQKLAQKEKELRDYENAHPDNGNFDRPAAVAAEIARKQTEVEKARGHVAREEKKSKEEIDRMRDEQRKQDESEDERAIRALAQRDKSTADKVHSGAGVRNIGGWISGQPLNLPPTGTDAMRVIAEEQRALLRRAVVALERRKENPDGANAGETP
jgi:DNA polymerase III alpha subunit (gram-positive type)